ncbi:hypothetical protein [Actinomadura madurae]|uniref:hypothetical protein n=1 Tax=Actinomadura madurae TaxID=1993 RepID=UPI0020D23881|nr:hypothetical protein [Actinomadura madurae]MCP9984172.1 hypothetical protein [Actinomadura madurae]
MAAAHGMAPPPRGGHGVDSSEAPMAGPAEIDECKVCFDGTHRARLPEDTLRGLEPILDQVGITRIADVTWLDEIGIPVYQAIRPDSWSLCVSQGKGLTGDLAKVSAVMESIELWHAERMPGRQGPCIPARTRVRTRISGRGASARPPKRTLPGHADRMVAGDGDRHR